MSGTRELRERLEALQSGIKSANEALAAPPPEDFTAELAARTAEAEEIEQEAAALEAELTANRASCAALRDEVERGEQNVLAPQATSSVPLLSVMFTLGFLVTAMMACIRVSQLPRTALLMLAVKGVGVAAPLAFAWVVKRRLMSPKRVPRPAPWVPVEPKNRG